MSNFQNQSSQSLKSQIESNQQMVAIFEAQAFEKEWAEGNPARVAKMNPTNTAFTTRDTAKTGIGYAIDAFSITKFTKMAADMGLHGQVILKTYDNKPFVIFKSTGNLPHFVSQLKQRLSKSKYITAKPQVVQMAVGYAQALKGAVRGGMITFAIFTAVNIMDYIIRDQATFTRLAGTIASDFAKISVGVLAGVVFQAGASGILLSVGVTSAAVLTLFPAVIAIAVGIGFGLLLNSIDDNYKLTKKIIAKIESINTKKEEITHNIKRELNYIEQYPIQAFSRIFGTPTMPF